MNRGARQRKCQWIVVEFAEGKEVACRWGEEENQRVPVGAKGCDEKLTVREEEERLKRKKRWCGTAEGGLPVLRGAVLIPTKGRMVSTHGGEVKER